MASKPIERDRAAQISIAIRVKRKQVVRFLSYDQNDVAVLHLNVWIALAAANWAPLPVHYALCLVGSWFVAHMPCPTLALTREIALPVGEAPIPSGSAGLRRIRYRVILTHSMLASAAEGQLPATTAISPRHP